MLARLSMNNYEESCMVGGQADTLVTGRVIKQYNKLDTILSELFNVYNKWINQVKETNEKDSETIPLEE